MRTVRIKTATHTAGLHGLRKTMQRRPKSTLWQKTISYWQAHSIAFEPRLILIVGTALALALILIWIDISASERSQLHSDRLATAMIYIDEIDRNNKIIDSLDSAERQYDNLGDNLGKERVDGLRKQLQTSNFLLGELWSQSDMSVAQQKYQSLVSIFILATAVVFLIILDMRLRRKKTFGERHLPMRTVANEFAIEDSTSLIEEAARASERAIIARDIHDELGALLMAVKMDIKRLSKNTTSAGDAVDARWEVILQRIDTAMYTVSRIAENLKPPQVDQIGFWLALENYIKDFQVAMAIPCSLRFDMVERPSLQPGSSDDIFHIFQEALTNVARHAKATKIDIEVRGNDDQLEIKIADNGTGISPAQILHPRSAGIAGMFERAKRHGCDLAMSRQTTDGTMVQIRIPLQRPK
jgi:signal transduction histidine kinase